MNILIIYASYSGGTQVASEYIAGLATEAGHTIALKRADEVQVADFDRHDLILIGSPSWMEEKQDGQPHHFYFEMMERLKDVRFDGKKFALFGLGDKDFARFTHAVDVLSEFITTHGGIIVHDPLRIDSFHFKQDESEAKLREWTQGLLSTS